MKRAIAGFACFLSVGCRANPVAPTVSIVSKTSQSISLHVGDELTVTLQGIGPGEYLSPPSVSSPAVRFLDVSQASVVVPAGPTEIFRFQAVAKGQAIVVFRH